jgi:hypothetical protein
MIETKLTVREQRLLILLPAAMVLVVYSFLIALPKQREYSSKLAELETIRETAVDEMTAKQSEVNLRLARDGLNRMKTRLQKDRSSIADRSQSWRNLESRLETVEAVTELLAIYNLIVVSQDYQEDPTVSEYMKGLFAEIDQTSATEVKFWQIELQGGYNEIQAFLAAINDEQLKTIPITLNMNATEAKDGQHTWTIIFVV